MNTFPSKTSLATLHLVLLLSFSIAHPVWAEKDLMEANKSDSTIKMLVFPKSLRVIENRRTFQKNHSFFDPKQIRKTLLKLDPARVVPAKPGEPVNGSVTRDSLKRLGHKYNEDILFIFQRTFDDEKNTSRHQGLLYLAKQKKVLVLKEIVNSGSESFKEKDMAGLKTLAREAKKILHSHKFEKRQSAY